uniref:Uncharacterized protein n=1 Tax=Anguilla anguilla TaxID=7936 RepID=A0A0E9REP4_ANGAN
MPVSVKILLFHWLFIPSVTFFSAFLTYPALNLLKCV